MVIADFRDIALDGFDASIVGDFEDIAELAHGTLALTVDGQFVIYGVVDPAASAEKVNAADSGAAYLVKVLGPDRLGFDL
jgi:hypothetical protein